MSSIEITTVNDNCRGKIDLKGNHRNEIIGHIRDFNDDFTEECLKNTIGNANDNKKNKKSEDKSKTRTSQCLVDNLKITNRRREDKISHDRKVHI